jgi:invasion protein IalB
VRRGTIPSASPAAALQAGRERRPLRVALVVAAVAVLMTAATSRGWAQAPAAGTASGRTEILTYDNWTVTCRDGRDAREKRICSAELDIVQEANNTRNVVFAWVIGLNKDGVSTTALSFPTGVLIAPGVELKFADKPARKIAITSCEPTHCEAATPMDESFIRDASAALQAEARIQTTDGRQITFTINLKGFTQAWAVIRK